MFFLNVGQNRSCDSRLNQTWDRYWSSTALNWTQNCRTVFSANFCPVAFTQPAFKHLIVYYCRSDRVAGKTSWTAAACKLVCLQFNLISFSSDFRLKTCILVPNQWCFYSFFYCLLIVILDLFEFFFWFTINRIFLYTHSI